MNNTESLIKAIYNVVEKRETVFKILKEYDKLVDEELDAYYEIVNNSREYKDTLRDAINEVLNGGEIEIC